MKKIKKLTENDFHNLIKKVMKEVINENTTINKCDRVVHPSVKKFIEILKKSTNNFNTSITSNWNEDAIVTVFLSIRSKDLLDNVDKALDCYLQLPRFFNQGYKGASILFLHKTFGKYEYKKLRPVLVHLANNLGQSDKIATLYDINDLMLSNKQNI